MNATWKSVANTIGTVAPWIASTLGSPLLGAGVGALCSALGLTGSDQTPEKAAAALATASPEMLLQIRQADMKHAEVMQQLGYAHYDAIAQIQEADRASARAREMAVKDRTPSVLAYAIIGANLALIGCLAAGMIKSTDSAVFGLVGTALGYLVSESKAVLSYYFAGSVDASEKDAIIGDIAKMP